MGQNISHPLIHIKINSKSNITLSTSNQVGVIVVFMSMNLTTGEKIVIYKAENITDTANNIIMTMRLVVIALNITHPP
jgi:hypothetical protein